MSVNAPPAHTRCDEMQQLTGSIRPRPAARGSLRSSARRISHPIPQPGRLSPSQPPGSTASGSTASGNNLAPILEADALRRKLATEVDGIRSERNRQAKEIGKLKASGADTAEVQKQAAELGDRVTAMQAALTAAEDILQGLLMGLPNLPDERSPAGGKEANQVIRTWGKQPDLGDKPLDHVELCTRLGLIDYARGVKLGGNGYWIYTGQGAALEWALLDFFNREHYAAGYQFMLPPHLLTEESGYAAGQFPKFHDDVFHIREEEGGRKSFLLPTSETAIVNVLL